MIVKAIRTKVIKVNVMRIKTLLMSFLILLPVHQVMAENFISDFMQGNTSGNFRLRMETVDIDISPVANQDTAQAFTLRSRLVYKTVGVNGLSANIEFEDVRAVANDVKYNVPGGFGQGNTDYAVVADPTSTELNEAYLKYKVYLYNKDKLEVIGGRQRIVYDNMRFVGNVGWRQDDQTFDALRAEYTIANTKLSLAYIDQVNGILGDQHVIDKADVLINAAIKIKELGTLVVYSYNLDDEDVDAQQDTNGARFSGKTAGDVPISYTLEVASQEKELSGGANNEADYHLVEAGLTFSGIKVSLGQEALSSDNGAYGFSTDLATKHAFNGWADLFLNTPDEGLQDNYVKVSSEVSGIKFLAVLHDYSADETDTVDDLGDELNISAMATLSSDFTLGAKLAMYDAGDSGEYANTDKFWLWTQLAF